jgi:hypothetical protein
VFDTADAFGTGERATALPGFVVADQPEQLFRFFSSVDPQTGRRRGDGDFRILYKPARFLEQHFENVCELALLTRDVVLVVDEVWMFCAPSYLPEYLKTIALRGRTPGVNLLWAAQRPSVVSKTLTSVSTELRVFRLVDDTDIGALRGRVPPAALSLIPSLPDREFISVGLTQEWARCRVDAAGMIHKL